MLRDTWCFQPCFTNINVVIFEKGSVSSFIKVKIIHLNLWYIFVYTRKQAYVIQYLNYLMLFYILKINFGHIFLVFI